MQHNNYFYSINIFFKNGDKTDFGGQTGVYRIHHHKSYITINCNGSSTKRKKKKNKTHCIQAKELKVMEFVYRRCAYFKLRL